MYLTVLQFSKEFFFRETKKNKIEQKKTPQNLDLHPHGRNAFNKSNKYD